MVSLTELRTKIADRIFTSDIKSSALVCSLVTPSINKWGDEVASYSAGSSVDVVPFLYIGNRISYQPFGDLQEGQVDFVIKYDVTIGIRDKIVWQGDNYYISEMDKSAFLGGGLVVQIIRCTRLA
jgi:hypothetical protein